MDAEVRRPRKQAAGMRCSRQVSARRHGRLLRHNVGPIVRAAADASASSAACQTSDCHPVEVAEEEGSARTGQRIARHATACVRSHSTTHVSQALAFWRCSTATPTNHCIVHTGAVLSVFVPFNSQILAIVASTQAVARTARTIAVFRICRQRCVAAGTCSRIRDWHRRKFRSSS
jgi:hypothetical protein